MITIIATWLSFLLVLPTPTLTVVSRPLSHTSSGVLHGVYETTPTGTLTKFLGIPYARPPVGDLRFKPPAHLGDDKADSAVEASEFKASCMQAVGIADLVYPALRAAEYKFDEDCLFLNVFIPGEFTTENKGLVGNIMKFGKEKILNFGRDTRLPIMIWLPGEGYNFASSSQYDMSSLATEGNVIVVTVNYRVSVFGFLSTGDEEIPGNMGLLDQLAAIRWMKNNADAFGGDPERITIFGRFTGAMSISALLVSPLAMHDGKPLFNRAIIQSGVAAETWTIDSDPSSGFNAVAEKNDCMLPSTQEIVECLRQIPANRLLDVSNYIHSWRLVLNKDTLPDEPLYSINHGDHVPMPVMIGVTNDDGSLCLLTQYFMNRGLYDKIVSDQINEDDFRELAREFLLGYSGITDKDAIDQIVEHYSTSKDKSWRNRYIKMCGDGYFRYKTQGFAEQLAEQGSQVYLYEFSHRPSQSFHPEFIEAAHGDDILFSLGIVRQSNEWTTEENQLSRSMMKAWTNFANTGNPNPMLGSDEEWPAFSSESQMYWDFSIAPGEKVKAMSPTWSNFDLWQNILEAVKKLL
uniref:Acetylcholinesterase n=1 Tax=Hemiscolopendra marginata TaxID=943146 RepID=A0A646QIJ6_9MYRI